MAVVRWNSDVSLVTVCTYAAAMHYLEPSRCHVEEGVTNQRKQCGASNPPLPFYQPLSTAQVCGLACSSLTLLPFEVNSPTHLGSWIFTTLHRQFNKYTSSYVCRLSNTR